MCLTTTWLFFIISWINAFLVLPPSLSELSSSINNNPSHSESSTSHSSSFESYSSFENGIPIVKKSKTLKHLMSFGNSIHVSDASEGPNIVFKVNGQEIEMDKSKDSEKSIPGKNGYTIKLSVKNGKGAFALQKTTKVEVKPKPCLVASQTETPKKNVKPVVFTSQKKEPSLDMEFPLVEVGGEEEDDDLIWF